MRGRPRSSAAHTDLGCALHSCRTGFGVLALAHGVLPAVTLLVPGAATVAPVAVHGHLRALATLLVLVLPSTSAALVSAYRGPLPPELLVGAETPFGVTRLT